MKLQIGKKADINYLSKVIYINNFTNHPDPSVNRMKIAHVDGYKICVGIDEPEGWYVYFPVLSQINFDLLQYLNLYRDKELNRNPEEKCGFFNKNGRVTAIKLRGFPSEGFLLPYSKLQEWILSSVNVELPDATKEVEFNEVEHDGKTFWVSKKYVVQLQQRNSNPYSRRNKRDNKVKRFDRIREDQFHFHYDTILIKKCPNVIQPDDIIHISSKWHGCVDADTIVEDSNGNLYTIKEVVDNKLNINIKAFDHTTNIITYVPIDNFYMIPNDGEWYEIELENGKTIKIIGNNPVFIPELNCYRRVDELKGDESLLLDF